VSSPAIPGRRPAVGGRHARFPEQAVYARWERKDPEILGGEEIVLSALVDDPELTYGFRVGVRPNLIDFPRDEIDAFVVAGFDADGVPTGVEQSSNRVWAISCAIE